MVSLKTPAKSVSQFLSDLVSQSLSFLSLDFCFLPLLLVSFLKIISLRIDIPQLPSATSGPVLTEHYTPGLY